ncbi:MAG TPA: hypothetical protein VGD59_07555 [Acidisarcina sp.]
MRHRPSALAILLIAGAFVCLAVAALTVWRVERALGGSKRELAAQELLPIEVRHLSPLPNPGFEPISAPAIFKSGAAFQAQLYLAGPAGLFVYSPDGALRHLYRTGVDLPASDPGALAVGTLADASEPELLMATSSEGVLAFNGRSFRQIRPTGEGDRQITAILPLASGRLLMGTAKRGLLVYDGRTLKQFHPTTSNVYVTALAGTESDLWIGTLNQGLLHWRGGETEHLTEQDGLPDARVEAIALGAGRVYVGTPVSVAELQAGKVSRILARGRFAHALLADGTSLLVGQVESGVLQVSLAQQGTGLATRRPIDMTVGRTSDAGSGEDLDHGRVIDPAVPSPRSSNLNRAATATVEQFLTVAGSNYAVADEGLLRQQPGGQWSEVLAGQPGMLTDRNVSSLMAASDGGLWVGYFDRGLDILPANGGEPVHAETEHVFCINRVVEDTRHAAVVVATANGLVFFNRDGRQRQVLTRESGLIANHVTDVALYRDGMVAGTPAGITFLDKSGAHSMYAFQGLVNNHVYALGAKGNQLLVGTLGGLSLLSGDAVQRNLTTSTSGLTHNWITGLVPLADEWLVGTYGAGVLRMAADGSISSTDATNRNTVINPGAMLADGRLVFAGTLGQGLLVGDATGTRWKTVTAGLPSLDVTALAVDRGVLYVGTVNGLVKIAESKLQ